MVPAVEELTELDAQDIMNVPATRYDDFISFNAT